MCYRFSKDKEKNRPNSQLKQIHDQKSETEVAELVKSGFSINDISVNMVETPN